MNNGKLIVIEGVDGSGKETQSKLLYERLKQDGVKVMQVSYPRYDNESSIMVKRYLAGEFGKDAKAVNPYIASTFYALDRYASYKEELEPFMNDGGLIIADRYTTSNMVHQAGKFDNSTDRQAFLNWLYEYEFGVLGLPVPDKVFFLNIPPDVSLSLMKQRANKITGDVKKDIHESDCNHLTDAYACAMGLVKHYDWHKINCTEQGELRSIENIHQEVVNCVKSCM